MLRTYVLTTGKTYVLELRIDVVSSLALPSLPRCDCGSIAGVMGPLSEIAR